MPSKCNMSIKGTKVYLKDISSFTFVRAHPIESIYCLYLFYIIYILYLVETWWPSGTLKPHFAGSSLSAASWLTSNILGQDVNSMPASASRGDGCHQADICPRHTVERSMVLPAIPRGYGTKKNKIRKKSCFNYTTEILTRVPHLSTHLKLIYFVLLKPT